MIHEIEFRGIEKYEIENVAGSTFLKIFVNDDVLREALKNCDDLGEHDIDNVIENLSELDGNLDSILSDA